MKYRKKPVVVEAFQLTDRWMINNADWPEWLHAACSQRKVLPTRDVYGRDLLKLQRVHGVVEMASPGDWLVLERDGEISFWRSDLFEATYEPAVEDLQCRLEAAEGKVERLEKDLEGIASLIVNSDDLDEVQWGLVSWLKGRE